MESCSGAGFVMPVANRDWSDPFLEQARADLRAAWNLSQADPADCASTLCMLLQMVFEKLAKAAFARQGQVVPRQHGTATRFFQLLGRHPSGQMLLRASPNVQAFVEQLENAQPSIAGGQNPPWPQLEYPWEDTASQTVLYPEQHLPLAGRVQNPGDRIILDCLQFASALEKQIPIMIP